ncbi:MAG: hypothetical protein QOJ72_2216 [Nocardioidaceae bacterium]|jgi:hypothetical protein|nr:hypothetical protein [Nocardioidaceae bacterium]
MRRLEDVDTQTVLTAMRKVQERTGVDLTDMEAQRRLNAAELRRGMRQCVGVVGGSVVGGLALVCLVLSAAPGDAGAGLRIAFVVVGVLLAAPAVWFCLRMLRPTAQFRTEFQPRRDALGELYREVGARNPRKFRQ